MTLVVVENAIESVFHVDAFNGIFADCYSLCRLIWPSCHAEFGDNTVLLFESIDPGLHDVITIVLQLSGYW